jgi:hypothetical protein
MEYTYTRQQCALQSEKQIYFKLMLDLREVALAKNC